MKGRHHRRDSNRVAREADATGEEPIVSLTGHQPEPLLTPEIVSVLKRLRTILGEAIEQGLRVGVDLTGPRLAVLCDELLREAREPGYKPLFGNSVEGFFLGGVFDDLVQQPSNIFSQVTGSDGKEYYVPLTASQWITCLEALRFSLLPHQ